MHEAAEKEWEEFVAERTVGVVEIREMRERVREEQDRKKAEKDSREGAADIQGEGEAKSMEVDEPESMGTAGVTGAKEESKQESKVVEKSEAKEESKQEEKDDVMHADDDDAVEY